MCENHTWRFAPPSWKQEDDSDGWREQRKYHTERCSLCTATRFTRPLRIRRRHRTDLEQEGQPPLVSMLNATQWRSIDALIHRLQRNRFEVQALLSAWTEAGWIEVEEVGGEPNWSIERARLSPLLVRQHTRNKVQLHHEREQLGITTLSSALHGWDRDSWEATRKHEAEVDVVQLIERIQVILEEQERAIARESFVVLSGTTMQVGGLPHQRWVSLLRGILELLANPRTEHERVFSARWLGDSKALHKEREALEAFLSIEGGLERFGLVKHIPVVLSWGNWQATWSSYVLGGQTGYSFTATPADTITQLQDMQVKAETLLIVENQTPFEILVHPTCRDARMLYLYGAGFPGQAQRELTACWLRAKPTLSWSVWTDYDMGGVAIQQHWQNWSLQEHLPSPRPYRWTSEDLALCKAQGRPLKAEQRELLKKMEHPLAQLLYDCGYSVEQEAILSSYHSW